MLYGPRQHSKSSLETVGTVSGTVGTVRTTVGEVCSTFSAVDSVTTNQSFQEVKVAFYFQQLLLQFESHVRQSYRLIKYQNVLVAESDTSSRFGQKLV